MEKIENIMCFIERLKPGVITATSVCGAYLANLLGGHDKPLNALLFFMLIDFALGISVAAIRKRSPKTVSGKPSSGPVYIGILKKVAALALIAVAHKIDVTMDIEYIRNLTVFAFLGQEGLSILENAILLGVKVPDSLKDGLDVLDKKSTKK